MNFLKSNLWEIDRSPLLHWFGAMLSLLHLLNYFYWRGTLVRSLSETPLICWDFFSNCMRYPLSSVASPNLFLMLYMLFSLIALLFFLWRRFVTASWIFFFLTFLMYILFYISEASLRHDVQSLFLLLSFGYLFVPSKIFLFRYAVIFYYLISAYHSPTPDWLSGSALTEFMPFAPKVLEWVAAIGIAIKFTLPFLLVSPLGQRLTFAVLGLLLYHGFIFYFQHDFSSLTMSLLVLFFVLDFFSRKKQEFETLYQSYAMPEPSKLWWPILIGCYLFIQTPFLPKTTPAELLRISGPPQFHDCQFITFANYKSRLEHIQNVLPSDLDSRLRCNPLAAFNGAKSLCHQLKKDPNFNSLSAYFVDRHLGEKDFRGVFLSDNICDDGVKYSSAELHK